MILTILVFIIVLSVLIFVHEFGHFITAKKSGMKVEEFGFGFPPRLWGVKKGETIYSVNWIPFGGFVKILGESGEEENNPRSFSSKSAVSRMLVLFSGVAMNIILAFFLLAIVNTVGLRIGFQDNEIDPGATNTMVQIVQVADNSPAQKAGIKVLDQIDGISIDGIVTQISKVADVQEIINANRGENIILLIKRGGQELSVALIPREDPPQGQGAIGISLSITGVVRYPWYKAIYKGAADTWFILERTVIGYVTIVKNIFTTGKAGIDLSGPVGIAVITGQAARLGFAYILQFMALISINLAVLNFIPFPALDGGRLLFILIEKLKGAPISKKIEAGLNSFGFILLILLMIYITTKDILRFF